VKLGCAKLWGSPPPSDSFWRMVERKGFKVINQPTKGLLPEKEKKVDVGIAYEITKDAFTILDKAKMNQFGCR